MMPEQNWATAIGIMHKKFGKDRACGSEHIPVDRQTHTQTYSSQYFATANTVKVIVTFPQETWCLLIFLAILAQITGTSYKVHGTCYGPVFECMCVTSRNGLNAASLK